MLVSVGTYDRMYLSVERKGFRLHLSFVSVLAYKISISAAVQESGAYPEWLPTNEFMFTAFINLTTFKISQGITKDEDLKEL